MNILYSAILVLAKGLYITVYVSLLSLIFTVLLGVIGGIIRSLQWPVISHLWGIYVWVIRGTPFLVQLFIVYYVFPEIGISMGQVQSAVFALSLSGGAYLTEIVRSGIDSVSYDQIEAGRSLGLNEYFIIRYIVLPQAFATIAPASVGQFIVLIKDSSVLSLIGLSEITRQGYVLNQLWGKPFIILPLVASGYFIICTVLFRLSETLRQHLKPYETG